MEKTATDIYSFRVLRENGFTYVDKTAMTTFLTDALRKQPLDFSAIDIDQSALEAYEPENPRLVTLLYQTGYLTIRSFHQLGLMRTFDLCIPNLEVENSFLTQLAPVPLRKLSPRSTCATTPRSTTSPARPCASSASHSRPSSERSST